MAKFKMNLPNSKSTRRQMLKDAQERIAKNEKRRELFWRDARDMLQSYKKGDQEEFQRKVKDIVAKHPAPVNNGLEDTVAVTVLTGKPPPARARQSSSRATVHRQLPCGADKLSCSSVLGKRVVGCLLDSCIVPPPHTMPYRQRSSLCRRTIASCDLDTATYTQTT